MKVPCSDDMNQQPHPHYCDQLSFLKNQEHVSTLKPLFLFDNTI